MHNADDTKAIMSQFFQDKTFRQNVLQDPEKTLASEGYTNPPPELVAKFKTANPDDVERSVAAYNAGNASTTC